MDDEERWRNRGAFFGSVAATLNHLLGGDRVWLVRLAGREGADALAQGHPYTDAPRDWDVYARDCAALDEALVAWADGLSADALGRTLRWTARGRETTRTYALCVAHLFNHQAHHRGQVHALLTAAGAAPGPTDLPALPDLG